MGTRLYSKSHSHQEGFTLVEVIVASLLLGLAVFSVVSLIRNGGIAEKQNDVRRQASRTLQGILESPQYHFSKFDALPPRDEPCFLDFDQALQIPCQLRITIEDGIVVLNNPANPIRFNRIAGLIKWTSEGRDDSVALSRSVSEVFWRVLP